MANVLRKAPEQSWIGEAAPSRGAVCPIDLVYLARQTLGDRGLELELLSLFAKQAGVIAGQLADPAISLAAKQQADLAHTLAGSARAIGATRAAAAAIAFEAALAGQPGAAATARGELAAAVAEARAAIGDLIGDR